MNRILFIIIIILGITLTGCDIGSGSKTESEGPVKIYKEIENPDFENIVKGKTYYSTWSPNIQSTIEYDTEKNIKIFKQYYASHYNCQLGPDDPPEYPFDFIYVRKSKYVFTEDLKDMAEITISHYKTNMNGRVLEEFDDYTDKPSSVVFSKLNEDGTKIKINYDNYYTAEALEEAGKANYILNPVK